MSAGSPPIFGSAVRRLVWRDISRNKRRTAGIFLLTFVPLLFVYFLAVIFVQDTTSSFNPTDEATYNFGQADAFYFGEGQPELLQLPGDPAIVTWNRLWHRIGGQQVAFTDIPIAEPLVEGHFEAESIGSLSAGALPNGPGEVAASPEALSVLGDDLDVGDSFVFGDRSLEVVGVPRSTGEASLLFAPGELDLGSRETLVDWGDQPIPDELLPQGDLEFEAMAQSNFSGLEFRREVEIANERYSSNPDGALGASIFMLGISIATGAVAFVAWRSSATRRLRETGLLASSGASGQQLAALQASQGFIIATVATVAALGVVAVVAVIEPYGWMLQSILASLSIPVLVVSAFIPTFIGIAAATLSAWWPAWQVARSPLAASLDGRLPEPRASFFNPVAGVLLMVVGVFLLSSSLGRFGGSANLQLLFGGGGLIALAVGVLPILRTLFQVAGHRVLLPRAPVTLRLILRSMARHAGRSAAAVLGIGAIIAGVWAGAVDTQEEIARGPQSFDSGRIVDDGEGSSIFTEEFRSSQVRGVQLQSGVFVSVGSPDAARREAAIDDVISRVGEPDRRVDFATFSGSDFNLLEARPVQEIDRVLRETIDNTMSTGGFSRLELPFFDDGRPAASEPQTAFDFSVLIYPVDLPQSDLDLLVEDDAVFVAGVNRSLGIARLDNSGPTDTQVQAILLAIGVVVAAFVIAMVTLVVSEEVRGEMALVALLGTSAAFARKFLAIHTFTIAAVGVLAGLFVGTGLRFVVDTGFFIPWFVLLALLALPVVLAAITYFAVRPARLIDQQSRLTLAA